MVSKTISGVKSVGRSRRQRRRRLDGDRQQNGTEMDAFSPVNWVGEESLKKGTLGERGLMEPREETRGRRSSTSRRSASCQLERRRRPSEENEAAYTATASSSSKAAASEHCPRHQQLQELEHIPPLSLSPTTSSSINTSEHTTRQQNADDDPDSQWTPFPLLTRAVSHVRVFGWEPPGRQYWDWNYEMPADLCRDGFALERTFLSYIHTSQTLAMTGIIIAQLFRLEHAPDPDPVFGFHVLGTPLACLCMGSAVVIAGTGAARFWREERALGRGVVIVQGWEMGVTGSLVGLLIITIFVLVVAIVIKKDIDGDV